MSVKKRINRRCERRRQRERMTQNGGKEKKKEGGHTIQSNMLREASAFLAEKDRVSKPKFKKCVRFLSLIHSKAQ